MGRILFSSIVAHRRRLFACFSAVLVAVAFLSGALTLGRTASNGISAVAVDAAAGTDVLVRSKVELNWGDVTERRPIDRSLVHTIAAVDGVAAVSPRIEGDGSIVGADRAPIGASNPTIVADWVEDRRLNPYDLAAGRAPAAQGEVVLDKASAERGHLAIGDKTVIRTPDAVTVRIIGLVSFGGADSLSSATYVGFSTSFAEQTLPLGSHAASIAVAAERDVCQGELVGRDQAVLPRGVEALTGAALRRELEDQIQGDDREAFERAVLVFAAVSLVAAALSIYNTFSVQVAQRTRESALLRALRASRGQVLWFVAAEALAVALAASVVGIAIGLGVATVLLAAMDTVGLPIPAASLAIDADTIVTGLAVGVGVRLLASLPPALRASRVAPLTALRDVALDRSATSGRRTVVGVLVSGAGAAATVVGATGEAPAASGLGALATLTGAIELGPAAARPAAALLGAPLAARRGMSGVLARRNAIAILDAPPT